MYYVYILFSETTVGYYCGQTSNLASRLMRHNAGETQSIKHGRPWKLVGYITCQTRAEAINLEKKIKKRGIARWLETNQPLLEHL